MKFTVRVNIVTYIVTFKEESLFIRVKCSLLSSSACSENKIDLAIMVEGSSSLNQWGQNNFEKIVNATKQIINYFTDPMSKVGIVLYATKAEVKANFSFTQNQANAVLSNLSYPSGWTRIGRGLNVTREQLFVGSRTNVHRVLVVFAEGTSNDAVSVASRLLRGMNVTIIVIALGDWYDVKQVQRMASDPHAETTFLTKFDELDSVGWKIQEMICRGNKVISTLVTTY